jgi:hypothetical protein
LSKALGVPVNGLAANTLRNSSSERLQRRMREMIKVISAAAGEVIHRFLTPKWAQAE